MFGYNSSGLWLLGLVATRSGGETNILDVLSGPLELDVGLLSACGDVKNCKNDGSYGSCGRLIEEPWRGFQDHKAFAGARWILA